MGNTPNFQPLWSMAHLQNKLKRSTCWGIYFTCTSRQVYRL